jgi:hypothetical protein
MTSTQQIPGRRGLWKNSGILSDSCKLKNQSAVARKEIEIECLELEAWQHAEENLKLEGEIQQLEDENVD